MKKVLITIALLAGISGMAQHKGLRGHQGGILKELSAEQLATLKTKKMALALDLNERQKQQMMALNIENAEFRKAKMEKQKAQHGRGELKRPTADEFFALVNERLDRKLAHQEKMKQILDVEQYEQWKNLTHEKHINSKERLARNRKG